MFANLIIQFFVKMNNLYTLRFWIYIVGSEPYFCGGIDVLWANKVHFYWIIESAKKRIMECVNEHSVFSKSDFWGKLKSIRNRINKDFTGTGLKIPKSENRKNPCFWEEKLSFWEIHFSFFQNVFFLLGKKKFLFFCMTLLS